jgi:CheY-like chemotaxis protein
LAAKETFLRGITHQLRTPIHGILGTVELLTEELKSRNLAPPSPPSVSSAVTSLTATQGVEIFDPYGYIKTIRTSAKELMSTVNSLIKLNRWTDVAQAERKSAFYLIQDIETALLDDSSPALSEHVSSKPSVVFCHAYPPSLDMLCMDLPLFVDCVQPLIVNAIQHTAGGVVAVTLSYLTDCNRLVVDVQDNGRGIAAEDQERIFVAYDKVDIQTTGAGLGLTLACKSANLMNGSISLVSSEIGKGSHFRAAFDDITCASSFPPRQLLKRRLVHLPPTFHDVAPSSSFPSLGHAFSNFLTLHGYLGSGTLEGSLMLLEYTEDVSQVHNRIQWLPAGQVAVCLVPDSATSCPIDFQQTPVLRQNNVIYVRAPLLAGILEEALELADGAMAETVSASVGTRKCDVDGDNQGTHAAPTVPALVDGRPEPQHRSSVFPPSIQTEIVESMTRLDVGIQAPKSPLNPRKHNSKPMTLLVDDNAVNLRILEIYCSRRSIPYRCAKDGGEAVSAFTKHRAPSTPAFDPLIQQDLQATMQFPFELILMDLQMPVCDGITATRRIRELEKENGWDRSTIIIVTGQDSPSDRTDAEEAGADGYLVKPVGPKVLDRWVKWWFPGADVG